MITASINHRRVYGQSSETVPAQRHLSLEVISTGTNSLVFGTDPSAAEQQRILLQETLSSFHLYRWKQVVLLRFQWLAPSIEPKINTHKNICFNELLLLFRLQKNRQVSAHIFNGLCTGRMFLIIFFYIDLKKECEITLCTLCTNELPILLKVSLNKKNYGII